MTEPCPALLSHALLIDRVFGQFNWFLTLQPSLRKRLRDRTVTKTVTEGKEALSGFEQAEAETLEVPAEGSGGAGRVRTAASQFCRLLP